MNNLVKYGELVVCVKVGKIKNLTQGKTYTIVRQNMGKHDNSDKEYNNIWIVNDLGIEKHYSKKRFVSVAEFRDIKLNELGI